MAGKTISINRAPVLTLWAAVVAERTGFDEDEALSLGKALTGLTAQAKGRRLGILHPHEKKAAKAKEKKPGEQVWVELLGRPLPAVKTDDGVRAIKGTEVVKPEGARRYLESKFGDDLDAARSAMRRLAKSYSPEELTESGFALYERFRPEIPQGVKGWGAKGVLDLGVIDKLAKEKP